MAGVSDSEETNFWPGYVDTLVNMVMFLVFLIVILAMAVTYFSMRARADIYKEKSTGKESSKHSFDQKFPGEADKIPNNPTMQDMRNLVERLKEKLYQSELRFKPTGSNSELKAENTKPGKSEKVEDASAKVNPLNSGGVQDFALRPTSMIIRFKPGALDLSPDEAKRMREVFVKHFDYDTSSPQTFQLTVDAAEGLSESNRMAFYRVVAVRNHLMGAVGVPVSKIGQKILTVPSNAITGMEALEVRITKVE